MTQSIPEGHAGNLTVEQELKLQEAWRRIHILCGVNPEAAGASQLKTAEAATNGTSSSDANDKYGQNKEFQQYLAEASPEEIRKTFWAAVKSESPDGIVLRFLRARKWDVSHAIVMLISAAKWRKDDQVEERVVRKAEAVALKQKMTADEEGFMLQWRSGKSYVRGLDKEGRPVYIIKVRLHNPNAQSDKAMEDYILHAIESIRILVKEPYDTACLIFDLKGFGLKNMDFPATKFIIKVFEARYPETLGIVLVNNAPWVFQGIWKVIKGWLDPVVASKIHFTNTAADFVDFIPKENLTVEYGGSDNWTYQYVEPKPDENDKMGDSVARDLIEAERSDIVAEYEKATAEWVRLKPDAPEAKSVMARRGELAEKLRANYWKLDPYIRARNFYDRVGVLDENGNVNFAPAARKGKGKK